MSLRFVSPLLAGPRAVLPRRAPLAGPSVRCASFPSLAKYFRGPPKVELAEPAAAAGTSLFDELASQEGTAAAAKKLFTFVRPAAPPLRARRRHQRRGQGSSASADAGPAQILDRQLQDEQAQAERPEPAHRGARRRRGCAAAQGTCPRRLLAPAHVDSVRSRPKSSPHGCCRCSRSPGTTPSPRD